MSRLVTFLGKGKYEEVPYRVGDEVVRTRYLARALAEVLRPAEVIVLATDEAWAAHGPALRVELDGLQVPFERRTIPPGADAEELWAVFARVTEALSGVEAAVLDITHGFRTLPFFAAACVAYLQALDSLPGDFQVVYGAFEAPGAEDERPVWVLDPFVDLLGWAQGVALLREAGNATRLLETFRREERAVGRRLARSGARRFPPLGKLRGALERFDADYQTVRVASLLRGYRDPAPGVGAPRAGSARLLAEAVEAYGEACGEHLPALRPLLERLREVADGLQAEGLAGPEGDRAMERLARRYLAHGRFAEAAVVVREGWISRHAGGPEGVEAGERSYSEHARARAERDWYAACEDARTVAEVRNDLEHGGFGRQPTPGERLRGRVEALVERFAGTRPVEWARRPAASGRTILVTRHAGAKEWFERRGIAVDEVREHLEAEDVHRGDTVVGTLPAHLAAEVCGRGAIYLHLAVDLPPGLRGRELTAEDLDRLGARLVPLLVRALPEG